MLPEDVVNHALMVLVTAGVVVIAVLLHYEACTWLGRRVARQGPNQRRRILFLMLGLISAHILEIWLFGFSAWLLTLDPAMGGLSSDNHGLLEYIYLSASTYTTVGYGDVAPLGPVRFLFGMEALAGFAIITWSASYTFLEMQRYWRSG